MEQPNQSLELMPEEVKILYIEILAQQILADDKLHPMEFSDLYLFMFQIGVSQKSRRKVINFFCNDTPLAISEMLDKMMLMAPFEAQEAISFSIIKDFIRISRVDQNISPKEMQNLHQLVMQIYQTEDKARQVIELAEMAIGYDEEFLKGNLCEPEFSLAEKNLVSNADSIGIPMAAVYFSGSSMGLSAPKMLDKLKDLGLNELIKASNSGRGIGAMTLLRLALNKGCKDERTQATVQEASIQELSRLNRDTMAALESDMQELAAKEKLISSCSLQTQARFERICKTYPEALKVLQSRIDNLKRV